MSSISACNAQFLPFLSLPTLSHKTHLLNPPFLVSSAANLTSSRLQHFSAPPRPLLKSRVRVSVISQDSELDGADEEETDALGVRGGDWGQQEEVSDADEALGGDGGEGYSVPPEGAKLFVGNLPFEVDSERLAGVFNQAGVVEVAEIIYNRGTDQSRGFGFVTMSTVEEAEKAMEMFNGYDLDGRELTVNKATRRGSQPIESGSGFARNRRIFVGNLPWQLDDARLEEVFGEYGSVVEARVVYERESGRSRGFGFVRMSTDKEIDDAIASLDGKNVDGRSIRVSVAEERPRRSSY